MALDSAHNRVLVTEYTAFPGLLAIDLTTGDRSVVSTAQSGSEVGSGPAIGQPWDVRVDPANDRAFVLSSTSSPPGSEVIEVNLSSGDRRIIAGPSTGRGRVPISDQTYSIAFDASANRLFLCDSKQRAVFVIDPDSGDHAIASQ